MKLREYQTDLIKDIRSQAKQHKSICVVAPCGSGKSVMQGYLAKMATDKGSRVLFLVHRKELCQQIIDTFRKCNVNFDLCKIGMVQTIVRRLDSEPAPDVIITDENHHCLANSYIKIYNYFDKAFKFGFTATPVRLGGRGLHPVYNSLLTGPTVKWLISNNFLSSFRLYSKKLVDTSNLHIRSGEYKSDEVNELMDNNVIYGDTVKNWLELAKDKKTIVYCSSIKTSLDTSNAFENAGIKSRHLDGKTNSIDREMAVNAFRNDDIKVLCNVDLFGEGFDVPDCECVILLRPTKSLSLYIQQSMRAMRYQENKTAVIIDHVGNCFEHGLPDLEHNWTLQDKEKKKSKKKETEEKIKQCPECFMVIEPHIGVCPHCNHIFEKIEKHKDVEDIILGEITSDEILKRKPHDYYKKIKTLDELIRFWELKKYKKGWLTYKLDEMKDSMLITEASLKKMQQKLEYKRGWWTHRRELINESDYNI